MRYSVSVTDFNTDKTTYHDAGQHLALAQIKAAELRADRFEEGF